MIQPRRREIVAGAAAALPLALAGYAVAAAEPRLTDLVRHPLLHRIYSGPGGTFDADDNAGTNRDSFHTIEEQRQGTEWIINGFVSAKPEWTTLGWRILDRGFDYQEPDGGFGKVGGFHSTSLYVEGLARAMLVDPAGATAPRRARLDRAASWLDANTELGLRENAPYTHRCYILAAGLGQAAAVTGRSSAGALAWADRGIARQRPDGVNPEVDGYDVSYQMVGVLHTMRYLPLCRDRGLAARLRRMARGAVGWELSQITPAGEIPVLASTRTGHEIFLGQAKTPNYSEVLQALVYGAQLVDPAWLEPARRIGAFKGLI